MLLDQSSYLEFCYFFQKVSDGIYLREELKKELKLSKFMATVYFISYHEFLFLKESSKALEHINNCVRAKCGVEFDKKTLNQIEVEADQANQMKKGTVADLFRDRFVTCLTLKIMYLWFFASMGYYFLAWGSIPGKSYVLGLGFNGFHD